MSLSASLMGTIVLKREMPLPFCLAMAGCTAIASCRRRRAIGLFFSTARTNGCPVSLCDYKKASVEEEKSFFHTSVFDAVRVKYRKGTQKMPLNRGFYGIKLRIIVMVIQIFECVSVYMFSLSLIHSFFHMSIPHMHVIQSPQISNSIM